MHRNREARHLEDEELVAAARGETTTRELTDHIAQCAICRSEVAEWKAIAEATRAWATNATLQSDRVDVLSRNDDNTSALAEVRDLKSGRGARSTRRRVLASVVVISLLTGTLAAVASLSSPGLSDAAILKRIGAAPAASAHGSVHAQMTVTFGASGSAETVRPSQTWSKSPSGKILSYQETYRFPRGTSGPALFTTVLAHRRSASGQLTIYIRYATVRNLPIASPGWYSFVDQSIPNLAIPNPSVAQPASRVPVGLLGKVLGIVGPIRRLGSSVIAGEQVTGYQVTINVKRAIAEAPDLADQYNAEGLLARGATSYPEQIWLNSRGEFQKVQYVARLKVGGTFRSTTLLSYDAKTFSITPPPAEDTKLVANEDDAYNLAYSFPQGRASAARG